MGGSDFWTPLPPRFVAFARRYPCSAPLSLSRRRGAQRPRAWGIESPRSPPGSTSGRRPDLPGSWGTSVGVPCSLTPAELRRQVVTAPPCCLPPSKRRRPPPLPHFRGCIARPVHSLSTLHLHGHPWLRKTRFRLVTNFSRAGLVTRRVPLGSFSNAAFAYAIPSSPTRLCLAHSEGVEIGDVG